MRRFIVTAALVMGLVLVTASIGSAHRIHRRRAHPIRHLRLWRCIHLGTRGGARWGWGEGNSAAGAHTGPLQMTYPWAGHYVHWYYVPIRRVYRIAELEYRKRGYSRSWLTGQWNGTAQPCLQFA